MSGNGNGRRLFVCIALSLALCAAHVRGSTILILGCLAAFMAWIIYVCVTDNTFPTLLFFLPFSPILRLTPDSYSFYTIALMLICFISVLKKKFRFKQYHLVIALVLMLLTILTKLLNSSMITFDYDVTAQVQAQPHGGVIVVKDIVIKPEDGTQGSGSFDVEVNDWGPYQDIYLPL